MAEFERFLEGLEEFATVCSLIVGIGIGAIMVAVCVVVVTMSIKSRNRRKRAVHLFSFSIRGTLHVDFPSIIAHEMLVLKTIKTMKDQPDSFNFGSDRRFLSTKTDHYVKFLYEDRKYSGQLAALQYIKRTQAEVEKAFDGKLQDVGCSHCEQPGV